MRSFRFSKKNLENLARQSGFRQRKSKLKGSSFLIALLSGLHSAAPSLETICSRLSIRISRQAIDDRFNKHTVGFLKACLEALLQKIAFLRQTTQIGLFNRLLIVDSTQWQISEKLARYFRGSGGSASKASCKLQTIIEPLTGTLHHYDYIRGSFPDQRYSKQLPKFLKPLDLLLCDLGYYSVKVFRFIQRKKAFFITPTYYNATIKTLNGAPFTGSVGAFLKTVKSSMVDLNVYIGTKEVMQVRLVAMRVSPDKADRQRRRIKEAFRKRGGKPTAERLECCDWIYLITNVPAFLSDKKIIELYATRWQIEIFFREAKSLLKLNICPSAKRYRFETQLLATLFLAALLFFVYGCFNNRLAKGKYEVSFDKLIKRVRDSLTLICQYLLQQTQQALYMLVKLFRKLIKHSIKIHQPSRNTPRENLILCGLA